MASPASPVGLIGFEMGFFFGQFANSLAFLRK
jgi:hypothetical protein